MTIEGHGLGPGAQCGAETAAQVQGDRGRGQWRLTGVAMIVVAAHIAMCVKPSYG
jgi:hypothetical protein